MAKTRGKYKRSVKKMEQLEKIRMFHSMGLSTKEMANVFDVSADTICYYLRQLGLHPNKRNDAAGHRSVLTLEICERCKFKDCIWNGVSPVCPMEFLEKSDSN